MPHRQLVPTDTASAATVLTRAFMHDPLWCHLFPNPAQRTSVMRHAFRAQLPWLLGQQRVSGVGTPLVGVAVWQPPAPAPKPWRTLLNPNSLTLLFSPQLWAFRRAIPTLIQTERLHQRYANDPHYYLSLIGVVPSAHGRGYASQLLRPVLEHADAQGVGVYTETMTAANVALYAHYGFNCEAEWRVAHTDLTIWSLYRPSKRLGCAH